MAHLLSARRIAGGCPDLWFVWIHSFFGRIVMRRSRNSVAFSVLGLATLILGVAAFTVAQTTDSAKTANQSQSSTASSAATKSGNLTSPKASTGRPAPAPKPESSHAANAQAPGTTAQIAPSGWVPQNPPGQQGAQKASAAPSQKKAASATQPHPKTTKPASTSTPKS